jgi:hypothetical protein
MRRALVICLVAGLLAACGSGGSSGAGVAATSSSETDEPIAGRQGPLRPQRARRKTLKILPSGAHGTELLGASVDTMLTNFLHANAPAA